MTVERPSYDAGAVVLQALAGGPLSGFEIARSCEGRVVGQSLAWLYPVLYKLEAQGAITSKWQSSGKHMRRRYSLLGAAGSVFAVWHRPANQTGLPADPDVTRPVAGSGSASTYLDRMTLALDLPSREVDEVRREIEDHLQDVGILDSNGSDGGRAVGAERLFGSPEQLAAAITWAWKERRQLSKTAPTSVLLAPVLLFFSAVAAAFVLTFLRLGVYVALRVVFAADASSATLALDQRQLAFPLAVGAFIAGRYLAGRIFAVGSRHGPAVVASSTALAALILGFPALGVETNLDLVTGVVLVCIPGAFILGAISPARYRQRLLSPRGVVAAVALGTAVIALPLDGLFVYSAPGGIFHDRTVRVSADPVTEFDQAGWSGAVYLQDPGRVARVCAEAQPVVLRGWLVDADPNSTGSPICDEVGPDTYYVNWGIPAPETRGRDWLLLVSIVDQSGQRHVVAASIVIATPYHGSVVGWLTGQPGD
jgi:hypothetical protein